MPAKPRKPAQTPQKLDTRALMRPGTQLVMAMADFDAADGYQIRIDEVGEVLRFSHGFCDEEDEEEFDGEAELDETVVVAGAALERGDEVIFLSQGSVSVAEETDGPYAATPPFMVSRKILAGIKADETVKLTIFGETAELQPDGGETVALKVNGEERQVAALRARDDEQGMTLLVLDDEAWPLLLSAEFQGDNYIHLLAIHALA